jgi:DUF2945 family protein
LIVLTLLGSGLLHGQVDYKGCTHHASADNPQYEIKSDKTDHIAMRNGTALHKIA